MFFVLHSTVEFIVGGEALRASPGDTVFGARGVPHSFHNVGDEDARMLVIVTPRGLSGFFAAVGEPADDLSAPPPVLDAAAIARIKAAALDYGVEILDGGSSERIRSEMTINSAE